MSIIDKPKVLHLFNRYLPQTENWIFHLISNLGEVQVYIGAKQYLKHNFYKPEFILYHHPFGEIEAYYSHRNRQQLFSYLRRLWYRASLLAFGGMKRELFHFTKMHQIDLVHAHFADVAWYYHKIPTTLDIPFVLSFYGWDYELLPRLYPKFKKRIQRLFEMATAIICEGEHGANLLVQKGCSADKIEVIPLGVDIDDIPLFQRRKPSKQLNLLQIASFTEKKGYVYTIEAFAKALTDCPNMHLTLVGGTSQKEYYAAIVDLVAAKGLKDRITFTEAIDYSQLHAFMEDFEVFIHPSCHAKSGDCEGGAPIVLLNAQATGLPIISTRHCDIADTVAHNVTGLLANEADIAGLSAAIETFYHMAPETYTIFSKNARQFVVENFDVKLHAQRLTEVYERLHVQS